MPSAGHVKKKESYKHKNHVDEELAAGLTALLPFLTHLKILPETANIADIDVDSLKNLAGKWNYDLVDPKSHHHITFSELIKDLSVMAERIAVRKADEKAAIKAAKLKRWEAFQENSIDLDKEPPSRPTSSMFEEEEEKDPIKALAVDPGDLSFSHISVKFPRNYFGLPTHALQRTSDAVVYQARAAEKADEPEEDFALLFEQSAHGNNDDERKLKGSERGTRELDRSHTAGTNDSRPRTGENKNSASQKKVAHALLRMASNDAMLHHFVNKGGIEAIYKLAFESTDSEVLSLCASCLTTASMAPKWRSALIEKQIVSNICGLSERGDEHVRFECARAITLLTTQENLHASLAKSGILLVLQNLLNSGRGDVLSYTALSGSNIAPIFFHGVSGSNSPEAEALIRVILSVARKLDVVGDYDVAFFISSIFCQVSRIEKYQALFVEEGGLALLLAILDRRDEPDVTDRCTEAFVNLSLMKKNQREIAASGIAFQFPKILGGKNVSPKSRAFCLMMIGNLLSAGYLHDKIATEDTVISILKMLDPVAARQFMAVSFVLSQIILHAKQSMDLVVMCGGVSAMCKQLNAISTIGRDIYEDPAKYKDDDGTSQSTHLMVLRDGLGYLWDILANIALDPDHKDLLVSQSEIIHQIEIESKKTLEAPSVEEVEENAEQKFIDVMQPDILPFLLNFTCIQDLEKCMDSSLLLKLALAVRSMFAKALGPSPWMKKIRMDTMTILVNLTLRLRFTRKAVLGDDLIKQIEYKGREGPILSLKYVELVSMISIEENCCVSMMDQGAQKLLVSLLDPKSTVCKDLISAAFHNMSLKRAALVPGQLSALLEMSRGTKSSRLLWITRTIANLSAKNKPRTALAKDRSVVAELAKLMRGGCDFAEKVQKYCAFAICNIMSSHVDKGIFEELINNRTISDIVVVTLLRINSGFTKEALAKALFNFLSRVEFRETMIGNGGKDDLDLLAAILELAKIELLELLAISIRVIFNISCEVINPVYAKKFDVLAVPQLLIARITHNKFINGARANSEIKLMCSMGMANLSFNKTLAKHMILDKSFADACVAIYKLKNDESLYCINTVIFNVSFLEECVEMHDSDAVNVLIDTLSGTLINCTQLAVGSLTNLSLYDAFYPQLIKINENSGVNAMMGMVTILGSPQIAMSIKVDCLHFVYNLLSVYPPSRAAAIEADCVPALAKFLKSVDGNDTLCIIGRIITEICTEAIQYISKLLNDGIMPVLLKMAKLEIPTIKYDISRAIYNLTTVSEAHYTMKVLKYDAVEILFWLTLHDCLDLYDPVKQHCVRVLRNFTLNKNEALFLTNEDRFLTVMKALITKTTNLDVLAQVAAVIYNVVALDECRALMLKRGVIDLIFEVARCNVDSIRHICSACLHMCPDDMPDMENPEVLSLVMCLLDADGNMFGELALRATEQLEYLLGGTAIGTAHVHEGTDFTGHWVTLVCDVDATFSPGVVDLSLQGTCNIPTKPMAAESMGMENHKILSSEAFNDFVGGHPMESGMNREGHMEEDMGSLESGKFHERGESDFEETERMDDLTVNTPDHQISSLVQNTTGNRRNEHTDMDRSVASSKFNEAFDDTSTQSGGDNLSLAASALSGEYHTKIRPIQKDEIQFPRLLPKQMPEDSLGAIKSNLYKKTNPSKASGAKRK